MNLTAMDAADAKRVVDFAAGGLIFGLGVRSSGCRRACSC
ncbi:hypothetical protein SPURM210S_08425 [Streptomyces purpurascens]